MHFKKLSLLISCAINASFVPTTCAQGPGHVAIADNDQPSARYQRLESEIDDTVESFAVPNCAQVNEVLGKFSPADQHKIRQQIEVKGKKAAVVIHRYLQRLCKLEKWVASTAAQQSVKVQLRAAYLHRLTDDINWNLETIPWSWKRSLLSYTDPYVLADMTPDQLHFTGIQPDNWVFQLQMFPFIATSQAEQAVCNWRSFKS